MRVPAVLALVAVALAGCALNPVSGRPELALISSAREQEIGKEESLKVEETMGVLSTSALTDYVEQIGRRLAAHSPRTDVAYTFHVVDTPEPNAFALPGGYVYVTRGLIALANSEDELAGAIGHEIAHVAARHSVQQVSRAAPFAVITGLGAAITGLASPLLGQLVGGVGGLASGLVLAPFNRDQEREADRLGQELMAQAGWDPAALSTFLHTLERDEALHGGAKRGMSFFASHPATPERVAKTAKYAARLQRAAPAPISPDRDAFLARLDGLVIGPAAAAGLFDGQRFLHPGLAFSILFPDGWQKQNGRQQIAAAVPSGAAIAVVEIVAAGDDPLVGARAIEKESGSPVTAHTESLKIGALPAARTRVKANSQQGELAISLCWIAYGGHVYQVAGLTGLPRSAEFLPAFDGIAGSFRPLTPADRARIKEQRLRLRSARGGETLAALVAASAASWNAEMAAVANGLDLNDTLAAGQLVKVAVREPYSAAAVP